MEHIIFVQVTVGDLGHSVGVHIAIILQPKSNKSIVKLPKTNLMVEVY